MKTIFNKLNNNKIYYYNKFKYKISNKINKKRILKLNL
jgi:hypothetical protein